MEETNIEEKRREQIRRVVFPKKEGATRLNQDISLPPWPVGVDTVNYL